jgi:uncharacterized membrane-anchored protein
MLRFAHRSSGLEPLAPKVPEITALFWVIKILTTGMGEAMSDYLGNLFLPLAAVVGIGGFWYAMRVQMRAREYRAPIYWSAVMMVAIFGTMVADGLRDGAGLSYGVTTPFFAVVVAAIFFLWHRSEGTLSIHSITTRRREAYYWSAVLATFALGTAAGDLTALTLKLGFLDSAFLFAAIIAVPALGWWRLGLNSTLAFWAAYVVTRPLGASFADWFGKPRGQTGIGLGDGAVSGLALIVFAVLVAYVALRKSDIQRGAPRQPHPLPHAHLPHLDLHVDAGPTTQPAEG